MIQLFPFALYLSNLYLQEIAYLETLLEFRQHPTEQDWCGYITDNGEWGIKSFKRLTIIENKQSVTPKKPLSKNITIPTPQAIRATLELYPGILFYSKNRKKVLYGNMTRNVDRTYSIKLNIATHFNADDYCIVDYKTANEALSDVEDWRVIKRKFKYTVSFEKAKEIISIYSKIGIAMKSLDGVIMTSNNLKDFAYDSYWLTQPGWEPIDGYFMDKKHQLINETLSTLCSMHSY
jgi:hypothetical protein